MTCDSTLTATLTAIGAAAAAFAIFKLVTTVYHAFYPFLLATPRNLKTLAGARWAVITGSTDGIGRAYAFELAARGFDIVLVSRTQSKLDQTAEEIRQKHQVEVRTIAFDFANPNLDAYQSKLFSQLEQLEIGILINNVGLSYEYPERLDRVDGGLKRVADVAVINTLPVTFLSTALLKPMLERNRGVIVNVGSAAAYHPMFYWAIYSATKKYVCWLSKILRKEYSTSNLVIQTVCPMLVATKMSKVRKVSVFVPDAAKFVRSAVNSIGNVAETTGCLAHELQCQLFFGLLPEFLVDKFMNGTSMATRSRALKKKAAADKSN